MSINIDPPSPEASARQAADARDRADMEKLQAGHDAALNDLMERHATTVFHFLYRMVGNEDDANDLAQETFVRIFKSAKSFRGGEKFSTWLFTIAANLARNHFRGRSRHPNISLDANAPPPFAWPCKIGPKICARRLSLANGKSVAWRKPPSFWKPRRRPWNQGFIAPGAFCASG